MILLDSDHLSVLRFRTSERAVRLSRRLDEAGARELIGTTVVNVEETMKGWLASIAKERAPLRQVAPYRELAELFEFFAGLAIAPFDTPAAERFATYSRIKIGAGDRKIAAIAVTQAALLLTANRRHFELIPGLRTENWLEG